MKTLLLLFLVLTPAGHLPVTENSDPTGLNGKWKPVSLEMGGNKLPSDSFNTQLLTISDSNYVFVAVSVDKGILRFNGNKMDIYGKDGVNNGKLIKTIWKLSEQEYNGEKTVALTICYNLAGDQYP